MNVLKPKQKLSQLLIRKKIDVISSQWGLQVETSKLPEARENANDKVAIVLVLHLIGWESGASFVDQSQNEVKENQSNIDLLSTLNSKNSSKTFVIHFLSPPPPPYVLIAFPLHGEAQMRIVSFLISRVWWGNLWWKNFPIRLFFEGCRPCNNSNLFIRSKGTLTGEYTGIQIIRYPNASNQEIDNFFSKICLVLYDLVYLPSVLFLKMFPHLWVFNPLISKLEISILYTVCHT